MNHEPEINALNIIIAALEDLNVRQRKRVLKWAKERFGLTGDKPPANVSRTGKARTETAAAADRKTIVTEEEPQETAKKVRKKKIKDFETVLDLFSAAGPKTSTEKVVLMAAYLQEKQDFQEISPYDISFRLKRIHSVVSNTSNVINEILKRKPPLMVEIKIENQVKSSRKKLRVTRNGLKYAYDLL